MSANLCATWCAKARWAATKLPADRHAPRAGGPGSPKAAPARRRTCPRTPAELASRLRSSLGDGQVNRLASLYDWNGKSSREAKPILRGSSA
jgi:hypothetical protein